MIKKVASPTNKPSKFILNYFTAGPKLIIFWELIIFLLFDFSCMKKSILLLPLAGVACNAEKPEQQMPNIVLIVADDLGLGDVSAYGSRTISTPNMDSIALRGIKFTNAYSTSATSTPSRYALFTGQYPWRNEDAKILPGDAPLLIPTDMPTLPKMLQSVGYSTAAIGKWHLGMGEGNPDWNTQISPSANSVGFDYTCVIAATNDRVPTVYVENGMVEGREENDPIFVDYYNNFEGEPTALSHPEMLKMMWSHGHNCSIVNGIPRIGYMKGGTKARWVDEDMADYFVEKIKAWADNLEQDKPFFLYYGLHQPHVPRAPHPRFVGSTGLGPRGDVIAEADWCVGEVLNYLREKGLMENTLVIFTSDNGPVLDDGYVDYAVEMLGEHDPMNGTRGGKYSLFDGGTHIPFIIYWEGQVEPCVSEAIICQMDLFASLSKLVGAPETKGIDSQELLDAFLGKSDTGREHLIHEAAGRLALRAGDYTMIPPYDGAQRNLTGNELGNLSDYALFNIKNDPAQQNDISAEEGEKLEEMKRLFHEITGK